MKKTIILIVMLCICLSSMTCCVENENKPEQTTENKPLDTTELPTQPEPVFEPVVYTTESGYSVSVEQKKDKILKKNGKVLIKSTVEYPVFNGEKFADLNTELHEKAISYVNESISNHSNMSEDQSEEYYECIFSTKVGYFKYNILSLMFSYTEIAKDGKNREKNELIQNICDTVTYDLDNIDKTVLPDIITVSPEQLYQKVKNNYIEMINNDRNYYSLETVKLDVEVYSAKWFITYDGLKFILPPGIIAPSVNGWIETNIYYKDNPELFMNLTF